MLSHIIRWLDGYIAYTSLCFCFSAGSTLNGCHPVLPGPFNPRAQQCTSGNGRESCWAPPPPKKIITITGSRSTYGSLSLSLFLGRIIDFFLGRRGSEKSSEPIRPFRVKESPQELYTPNVYQPRKNLFIAMCTIHITWYDAPHLWPYIYQPPHIL